jgi:nucleotide-binding universal stress UspA family protein
MGTIAVGFIDSAAGWAALDLAIEEARLRNSKLVVVNSMFGGSRESAEEYISMNDAIEAATKRLTDSGVDHDVHQFVRGQTPAQDLIQAAKEFEVDLIVIGIRRRSATGKLLLGSNALEILHDAPCPVMCVRKDDAAPAA